MLIASCLAFFQRGGAAKIYAAEDGHKQKIDYRSEYEAIAYDEYDGLVSSEINAVAQTADGYIWSGTYSGLYRYDGFRFEKMSLDDRISNVMILFSDSLDRLWIGTNDSGICRYDPKSGEIVFYTADDGLAADSIRSICEDEDGNIYVGTVSWISVIDREGNITNLDKWLEINRVRSLCYGGNGVVAGVSNSGTLFFIKGGELLEQRNFDMEGIYYGAVCCDGQGNFVVGTSGSYIDKLTFDGSKSRRTGMMDSQPVSYYNNILYDPSSDGYFFCAENGLGYIDYDSEITFLMQDKFENSISDVIIDYQGNIWFVSNKQGIMEYSRNPFVNIFVKAGLAANVVNSLMVSGEDLYIATDSGLAVIDKDDYSQRSYAFLSYFDGVRIRHMMEDSHGNRWISTYGRDGLIRISPSGIVRMFNESSGGTLGGRFRYAMELSDGTIVAASNMGLTYIKGDKVIKTIGEGEGLTASQILTMVEMDDGSILAGSDGDGIYIIKDGTVQDHIGLEQGLNTLVVLRIVECDSGYIYVTSNAIYYDNKEEIKKLTAFPYSNNYDVYIADDGSAWISSSAGIYIVRLDELLANEEYHYTLMDYSRGFDTSLTANAWNTLLDLNGTLLLCCTDGVRQISTRDYNSFDDQYYIRVNYISSDDEVIRADSSGTYVIPPRAKRIQIQASVLNYTLSNPLVRLYLEGAEDEGKTVYQNELTALSYTNLPYGQYKLHIQILDSTRYSVLRDEVFPIKKDARFSELLIFRIGLVVIAALFAAFLVWYIMNTTIIRRQYDQIRQAKDEAERANSAKSRFLANMSHEIRTPINTIMGMDEMILRENASPVVIDYAVSIKRASESLLGLVNDILDLSKIESGKMNLVEQDYYTVELLRSLTTMIRVRSNEKDLGFATAIDPSLPAKLYGDAGKIKQVVLNLLTNAVKYTEKGSFTLNVKVVEKTEERARVYFSVKDTGIGIKPEDMDKLFSAFERLDEKRNSGIQGTGLGLDISRQFVELMGDELRCDSVYGEGSNFYFTIEQKIVDPSPIGEFTEKQETQAAKGPYVPLFVAPDSNILVVDDNEMNLQVLSGLLRATKIQITTAMSGKECLKKVAENHYDIVLLDHMMPEMDGIETLHELRKINTDIPVLALTANAATGGESYYVSEGFQGYLSKPIDGRKLEEALKHYLPDELLLEPTPENLAASSSAGASDALNSQSSVYTSGGDDGRGSSDAQSTGVPEWLLRTEGISVDEGIRCCGSPDAYVAALRTFYDTLSAKADEIASCYSGEDWKLYTIKVHALKSSARIIGAEKLSRLAEDMENAGHAADIEAIRQHTGELLMLYRSYLDRLSQIEEKEDASGLEDIDESTLTDAYSAILEMSEIMDYDSVEMVLDSLKKYKMPPEDRDTFREIGRKLIELDWDAMAQIVRNKIR